MIGYSIIAILAVLALASWTMFKGGTAYTPSKSNSDFYSLSCKTIEGNDYDFNQLNGKRVLIVNTASECGFTPQYKGLQKLHEQYGESLTILGFPCNDFGSQESGSSEEINTFCSKNYGVSFQMMEKISIKGDAPHPVYVWLLSKSENRVADHTVRWNFHKFLIDENGSLVGSYKSGVNPTDNQIISFASGK